MKYTKKIFALLLALILPIGILAGCQPQSSPVSTNTVAGTNISGSSQMQASQNNTNTVDQNQTDPEESASTSGIPKLEKRYCEVSTDQDFKTGLVFVEMAPEVFDKQYTAEDFADIGCVKIIKEDIVTYPPTPEIKERIPRRYYELQIEDQSKEGVIQAIKILEQRADTLYVTPAYRTYTDATPTDAEYTAGR